MAFDETKFKNSLHATLSATRIKQKEIFRKALLFYQCNSEVFLEDILGDQFADFDKIKDEIIFREMADTKGIVDNISLVYRQAPERTYLIDGKETENTKLVDYINSIYDGFGNSFFQMHEKLVNAMSTCAVKVNYDTEDKRFNIQILTPDRYDVIVDELETTKPTAFFYQLDTEDDMTNKQNITTFFFIDKDSVVKINTGLDFSDRNISTLTATTLQSATFEETGLRGDDGKENELGFIPIITTTSEQQVMDYFVDSNARCLVTGEEVMIFYSGHVMNK